MNIQTIHQANVLLNALLDEQIEEGDVAPITMERMREVLEGGGNFTEDEVRVFRLSPVSRAIYWQVRRALRLETLWRWRRANLTTRMTLLSADAPEERQVYEIEEDAFRLFLYPHEDPNISWILSVHLNERTRQFLPSGMEVRLVDGEGAVWLVGKPGLEGAIIGQPWPFGGAETPLARLLRCGVTLEPC